MLVGFSTQFAPLAHATHFRFGILTWELTGNPGEVEFRLVAAFRRGYLGSGPDGLVVTGDIFLETIGGTGINFGDGSPPTGILEFVVVAFDVTGDWVIAEALHPGTPDRGVLHTYADPGVSYTATVASCCRINGTGGNDLNNRRNGTYSLATLVTFDGNTPPTSSLVPIVVVQEGSPVTFFVPAADADGDPIQWRLSTDAEAGGGPHPPGMSVNPGTGEVTWENAGLDQTNFWTTQVIIEDLDAGGNVKSMTPVDFLLLIVPPPPPEFPECTVDPPGPFTVAAGSPVSFTITGTDADPGDDVTLNTGGLPAGATMTPALPVTGPSGVTSTFNWTPAGGQTGAFVLLFSATDQTGRQGLCSTAIVVAANQPPDCSLAAADPDELWPPNGMMHAINIAGITDPDDDPTTITVTGITQDEPVEGLGDGHTAPDGDGVGTPTAHVRAERSGTRQTPGNGRVYEISFTADDGQGGTCSGAVQVCVPHDQRPGHVCVDDGQHFDSTVNGAPRAAEAPALFEVVAHPNPFNPVTTIHYVLPEAAYVRLTVYDVTGREIVRLAERLMEAGVHQTTFDASGLPSGLYLVRLATGAHVATRTLMLVK